MLDTPTNGKRRSALGKGISALIPTAAPHRPDYFSCPLDRVRPMHDQPRKHFDETALAELAGSIERDGMLQPIVVRQEGSDYIVIAGERRLRAARLAGLEEVPVILKDASDADAFALALVENLQREDLSPLEMAEACQRLIDEHGYTQEQLAQRIGKSRSAIANTLRLLKLDAATQSALAHGLLSEGHARQLVGLDADTQADLVDRVVGDNLSVRETEAVVRELRRPVSEQSNDPDPEPMRSGPPSTSNDNDDALAEATEALAAALGVKVDIKERDGRGMIQLHWSSYADLEALVEQLTDK